MDTLTLTGRGGTQLVLFAPRAVEGGVEAFAIMVSAPILRPRIFRADNKRKYRVPALPERAFLLAHVVLPEVAT